MGALPGVGNTPPMNSIGGGGGKRQEFLQAQQAAEQQAMASGNQALVAQIAGIQAQPGAMSQLSQLTASSSGSSGIQGNLLQGMTPPGAGNNLNMIS